MTVPTLPLAGAGTSLSADAAVRCGPLGGPGGALGGGLAGVLGLLLGLRLLLGVGEVRLGLLGGLGGGRVALGAQLVVGRGLLGDLRGLGDLGGQVGREGGQLEGLGHRLGSVGRSGRTGHCQGAEDATGNSGAHRERRAAARPGFPVAAYVSGVGHGTTGIRGSSIPSRNVWCATVVQWAARIPGVAFLIDAVTGIADTARQACDHGLSVLRPNCPRPTTRWSGWPSPVVSRPVTNVTQVTERLPCGWCRARDAGEP